ncbi:Eco57I restriction-modification methylase domain-containing protein [Lysinibacillus xylanilyticus]|uniref:Eco57I restriction-modification methylase domain-containing protein n=1 Tax=Lysinibacillus xylanilyticus TaxID=582475 RepID=UPI003CFDAF3A
MKENFLNMINNNSIETTSDKLRAEIKMTYDQYFTPIEIASFMSSMFKEVKKKEVFILDPGCGIGNLTASLIVQILKWKNKPKVINLYLCEIDNSLDFKLQGNLQLLRELCARENIQLNIDLQYKDFILYSVDNFELLEGYFDFIITNPPYRKMSSDSTHKKKLLKIGIDVPNYYAAFIALAIKLLSNKGQIVCIIPRSFCNGVYFKNFRYFLDENIKFDKIHIFKSRKDLFHDDVLQETVILSLFRATSKSNDKIQITESLKNDFHQAKSTYKRFDNVIFPTDIEKIIRIIHTADKEIVDRMHSLPCELMDLGISVSTGPIVDFRELPGTLHDSVDLLSNPMIYQDNIKNGVVNWPEFNSKPCVIIENDNNKNRLRPAGIYVLVKRMTTKEEPKRIIAGLIDNSYVPEQKIGFDNKLNYFHINYRGLEDINFAKGLCLYLNSSMVDFYFRTFSGSTQVNVADLKSSIKYPSKKDIITLGSALEINTGQEEIDSTLERILVKDD